MFTRHALHVLALRISLVAGVLATSVSAQAASALAAGSSNASARLDVQVVIPSVLRVLEDSHPSRLPAAGNLEEGMPAVQRIVMLSTLRKGFCLDLRLSTAQIANWKMQLQGSSYARMETTADGYRLCVSRAGRHELALSHEFGSTGATPLDWPVYLSLSAP